MAQPNDGVLDDCEDEFEMPEEIEACKMGARQSAGAGETNVEVMMAENDLHDDVEENVRAINAAFTNTHSSTSTFANTIGPKLDDLEEDLADRVDAEPWAVANEISEAYYYGVGEQIEYEVKKELGGRQKV